MAELQWLWDDPIGIPEAEDIGPAVGAEEIARWETQYGVPFPPILKRAYGQQDGGYIRGSDRGVILLRLRDIEPVETDLLSELSSGSGEQIDSVRVFYLGGDDTGATLLLGYSDADTGGADPSVFAFYSDGGEIEPLTDTVDALFGDTLHG
jgi:hypothetical protein